MLPLPDPDPETRAATALCTACGLCCNGAIFKVARAERDELDLVAAGGMALAQRADGPWFELPCKFLSGTLCSVYADRFSACRSFTCTLLKRVTAGEIGIEEGLGIVATAKDMIGGVAAKAPAAATLAGRARIREAAPDAGWSGDKMADARLHLDSVALDFYLDKHFRNKKTMAIGPAPGAAPRRDP